MTATIKNVIAWNERAKGRALKQGRKRDAARHQSNIDGLTLGGAQ